MIRIRFNHVVAGEIVESDVIEATPDEWEDFPESKTGAWSVHKNSDRVIANRLVGVPVLIEQETS
jgi:hypothetical protein